MNDLTGKKYSKWLVLGFHHKDVSGKKYYWLCQCACGRESIVCGWALLSGNSKSCKHCAPRHVGKRKNTNTYVEHEAHMECVVSNGKRFIYDKIDQDIINAYTWSIDKTGAVTAHHKQEPVILSRAITNCPHGLCVDHINHDKSDNRRINLRICTAHENTMNCSTPTNNTSGYKGVCWHGQHNLWRAYIRLSYRQISLGLYANKEDAARAYNRAAIEHYGEYACLNQV